MAFIVKISKNNDETVHIFPAKYDKYKDTYYPISYDFEDIVELENNLLLEYQEGDIEANPICNDDNVEIGKANATRYKYECLDTVDEVIDLAAALQKKHGNVCGNCVRRLYKNDD
ncbi:hypothetical protein [Brachyspira pilosicoli]|uniref:hypothetical protein n=1 Tax=Brachyspira pilosicoli TaxID=52584 RepID=UPI0024916C58|nr:hypothetical protein [Brachyspira pilosicoli]